jgi:CheY-like chemotaxis protein
MDAVTQLLPRASTGVAGLDRVLEGGVARNRLHLLEGSPGAGKTTIALQFLVAGAKVFEPFFTTKEVGKGSGLGLSQVLGFAKQSGGGVCIESRPGVGTSVHIYLPRAEVNVRKQAVAPARVASVEIFCGSTILLIDDDNAVREVTRAILHGLGYRVLEAGSGGAALDLLEREPNIDLMVADFAMPGMNGAEVARLAQAKRPTLPVLFVTGFADRRALAGISEGEIINKPFIDEELADKVGLALAEGASKKVVRLRR